MATYLKGVTDYIPQIQPWSPDYNFYQNALERKQTSYDRGWEQTNTIYNSILNAPMMREQNIERRDNFFKEIEGQIQQMSSVDLSLQQNVDAASTVFKPFYENDDIVHDIAYTRKYQDQIQQADYLKNCTDKEKCGGKYWAGGKRLLGYKAQEFINATDEEALRMQAPSYTNYVNVMDKATKAMDAVGKGKWEMVTTSFDGGYKIQTKNGKQQISTLKNFMMSQFGDDPEVTEFFGAKAELMGYEDPEKLINIYELEKLKSEATTQEEFDAMVKERSERNKFDAAVTTIDKKAKEEKSGLEGMIQRQAILDGIISSEGILPDSKEAKQYRDLKTGIPIKEAAVKKAEGVASYVQNMQYIDEDGNKIPSSVINNVVANALLMNDIDATASTLAFKDYSVTMEADSYALANYKHGLDVARDDRTAERTNADATIKYIRDRGAADKASKLEKARRDAIDDLTIGDGMTYKGTKYKGLSNADALVVYRELFAANNNTGNPYYDGGYDDGSGKTVMADAKVDTKLANAIDAAFNGNEEQGDAAAAAIDDANQSMYTDAFVNFANYQGEATDFVNNKMKGLIQTVTNPSAENQEVAAQGLLLIGDMIAEAKEKNTPFYKQMKQSGAWDKYFEEFPNSVNRATKGSKALTNLNIDAATGYISALVGNDKIISLLNNEDVNISVYDKKDPTLIDTEALGIISHAEANRLLTNDFGSDPGSFVDTNTDEEKEALSLYLHKTDSIKKISSENYLHTLITDEDSKTLTRMSFNKANAKGMLNSLNKSIDGVAKYYGEKTDGEKDGVMRSFMRKNIIVKPKPDQRKVATRADMYNAAAAEGVELLKSYDKENITTGISPSIAELEQDVMSQTNSDGFMFQGDALKGILATSEMPVDIGAIDFAQLYEDNNIPVMISGEFKDQGKTGWRTASTESLNYEPMWSTLIDDPKTQIVREGNNIAIKSPYLNTPNKGLLLNASDVETDSGVEDMFNDIDDQYGNIVHGYGKLMQHVPDHPSYLTYGTGGDFTGSHESNYNVTSRTATDIRLVPNNPIPAYQDYIQLFKEAQDNVGAGFGEGHQGDPVFLNNVIKALEDTYDDGKNMPIFDVDYTPVAGSADLTRVHIKLNDYKAQDWIKAMGLEVTGFKMPDQEDIEVGDIVTNPLGTAVGAVVGGLSGGSTKTYRGAIEGTYYIKDSKSRIIEKSKPNSYHNVMANIPVGNFYIDESNKSTTQGGVVKYVRSSRDRIHGYIIYPEYNKTKGTTYKRTLPIGDWPIIGTDWESRVDFNNAGLKLNYKDLKDYYKKTDAYITDPSEL
jgi:hypothetical protein